MNKSTFNKFYLSILFFIILSISLFVAVDYFIQTSLDNLDIIALKESSSKEFSNLDNKINKLKKQLNQLQKEVENNKSHTYPTLYEIKQISKKFALKVENISKTKEITRHKTDYMISFQGSIYNILKFLKLFESSYICDIKQLTLRPSDISGEKLSLQLSIRLKT